MKIQHIVVALAFGASGVAYYVQSKIVDSLTVKLNASTLQVETLNAARGADSKRVRELSMRVQAVSEQRGKLMGEIQDANKDPATVDYMAMPVPDGMRHAINAYLAN